MAIRLDYPVNKRSLDGLAVWLAGGVLATVLGEYLSERLVIPVLVFSAIGAIVWGRKRVRDEDERLRAWARAETERRPAT